MCLVKTGFRQEKKKKHAHAHAHAGFFVEPVLWKPPNQRIRTRSRPTVNRVLGKSYPALEIFIFGGCINYSNVKRMSYPHGGGDNT